MKKLIIFIAILIQTCTDKEMEENLPGLGSQRSIVQWVFNEDTSVGDIRRFNVNNGYVF